VNDVQPHVCVRRLVQVANVCRLDSPTWLKKRSPICSARRPEVSCHCSSRAASVSLPGCRSGCRVDALQVRGGSFEALLAELAEQLDQAAHEIPQPQHLERDRARIRLVAHQQIEHRQPLGRAM
jgi:hypothetical protein